MSLTLAPQSSDPPPDRVVLIADASVLPPGLWLPVFASAVSAGSPAPVNTLILVPEWQAAFVTGPTPNCGVQTHPKLAQLIDQVILREPLTANV